MSNHFWSKVEKTDGCWFWRGRTELGYGRLSWRGRQVRAHRLSYELAKGPIPDGLVIDHICRNKSCVNPAHLRAVTDRENLLAPGSQAPAAANLKKTKCPHGHSYVSSGDGRRRRCRECNRERMRRNYQRQNPNVRQCQRAPKGED